VPFLSFFFLIVVFTFTPAYRKSAFIELTSFKSLFSVKFKPFTLDESQHFLKANNFFCENGCNCESLYAVSACSGLGCALCSQHVVKQEIIVSTIIPVIFIFTSFLNAQQHGTVDRSQVATLL